MPNWLVRMRSEAHPRLRRESAYRETAGLLERTSRNAIFIGTIVTFAIVTVVLAANLNLYIDEAYSLHTTDGGIASAFHYSIVFEQQPPLYFILLATWRTLDHSIFFARLLSIACCLASIFVFRRFAVRTLKNVPDWLPSLIFALNPFVIWTALEIRVYALILLLSTALISLFFEAFVAEDRKRYAIPAFVVVAVAAMYTHYFFVATFAGFGLILIVYRRKRFFEYVGAMAVLGIAMIPLLTTILAQVHDATVEMLANPPRLAQEILLTTGAFVLPHRWINALDMRAVTWTYQIVFFTMLIAAFVGLRHSRVAVMLTLLVATIVAFFLSIVLIEHEPIETPRHIATVFVPVTITVIAAVTATFRSPARRGILLLYLAIFAVCAVVENVHTYNGLAKIGDWQRVASYVQMHAQPSEPIVVFDAEDALPIRYYYSGRSHIIPIPKEQRFDRFDRRDFALRSYAELERTFPMPSPSTRKAWLVRAVPCRYALFDASCDYIDRYIRKNFTSIHVEHFYRSEVYELRERSKAADAGVSMLDRHKVYKANRITEAATRGNKLSRLHRSDLRGYA